MRHKSGLVYLVFFLCFIYGCSHPITGYEQTTRIETKACPTSQEACTVDLPTVTTVDLRQDRPVKHFVRFGQCQFSHPIRAGWKRLVQSTE